MNPFKYKRLDEFTIADCEQYITNYPHGELIVEVKTRLKTLTANAHMQKENYDSSMHIPNVNINITNKLQATQLQPNKKRIYGWVIIVFFITISFIGILCWLITQRDVDVSKHILTFDTTGGCESVMIYNSGYKKISIINELDSWISASIINKTEIHVICTGNERVLRSGTIYITCGLQTIPISIKQNGWKDCKICGGTGNLRCPNQLAQYCTVIGEGTKHMMNEITGYGGNPNFFGGHLEPIYSSVYCNVCGGDGIIDCECNNGKIKQVHE